MPGPREMGRNGQEVGVGGSILQRRERGLPFASGLASREQPQKSSLTLSLN